MNANTGIQRHNSHLPFLDGCRGVAILLVIVSHAGLGWLIPGKFGVTLFFFISGYLITRLLLAEIDSTGKIHMAHFYLRRFFRLYPALLVMILFSIGLGYCMRTPVPGNDILSALFYFTNYYIGWIRPPVQDTYRLLDIIWSLSVEEHFYFFFPVLTYICMTSKKPGRASVFLIILVSLSIIAFLLRCLLFFQADMSFEDIAGRVYFSSHTRMDSILWGCIAAFITYKMSGARWVRYFTDKKAFYAGCLLLLLSFTIRWEFFRQTCQFSFQGIGLLCIIPALQNIRFKKIRQLTELPLLMYIGKISYSLYLFHWGISKLANSLYREYSLSWQLLYWTATIALSLASYYGIEKPFMKLRKRFGSTAV